MTTEEDFHRALDANPEAHHTRLVFADWLQERGDPRAEGYRALGQLGANASNSRGTGTQFRWEPEMECCWFCAGTVETVTDDRIRANFLPADWFTRMSRPGPESTRTDWHTSRRAAEDAAALAFAMLPAVRRAELLTGEWRG